MCCGALLWCSDTSCVSVLLCLPVEASVIAQGLPVIAAFDGVPVSHKLSETVSVCMRSSPCCFCTCFRAPCCAFAGSSKRPYEAFALAKPRLVLLAVWCL